MAAVDPTKKNSTIATLPEDAKKQLVAAGWAVGNKIDDHHKDVSPLMWAVVQQNEQLVITLLAAGANQFTECFNHPALPLEHAIFKYTIAQRHYLDDANKDGNLAKYQTGRSILRKMLEKVELKQLFNKDGRNILDYALDHLLTNIIGGIDTVPATYPLVNDLKPIPESFLFMSGMDDATGLNLCVPINNPECAIGIILAEIHSRMIAPSKQFTLELPDDPVYSWLKDYARICYTHLNSEEKVKHEVGQMGAKDPRANASSSVTASSASSTASAFGASKATPSASSVLNPASASAYGDSDDEVMALVFSNLAKPSADGSSAPRPAVKPGASKKSHP